MEARAGESPQITFSVEPELPASTIHTVTRIDDKKQTDRSDEFLIKGDTITFPSVKVSDAGTYAISFRNSDEIEGKKNFKLKIKSGMTCMISCIIYYSINLW